MKIQEVYRAALQIIIIRVLFIGLFMVWPHTDLSQARLGHRTFFPGDIAMDNNDTLFKVQFTEQQLVLLHKVLEEGTFGKTMEEVCHGIFRQFTEQLFGKDGN